MSMKLGKVGIIGAAPVFLNPPAIDLLLRMACRDAIPASAANVTLTHQHLSHATHLSGLLLSATCRIR
jgi:predicted ATPase